MATTEEQGAFYGSMPDRAGDVGVEQRGMAPIPIDNRFGSPFRMFTVWFGPNMQVSAVFVGVLGGVLGLGFGTGVVAIVLGTLIGVVPVAYLCTWGPRTGMGQIPFGRTSFGKSIVVPGLIQWASSIGWDALIGIFGAEALQQLFGIPFWLGAVIALGVVGVVSIVGYEIIHQVERWLSVGLGVMFVIFTVKLAPQGNWTSGDTVHGAALIGMFILFSTICLSESVSYGAYASDYSRYMKPETSSKAIFWWTFLGLGGSFIWMEIIGIGGSKILTNYETASGFQHVMGGGALGVLALIVIALGCVATNALNDYTGSLAFQSMGLRIYRPIVAAFSDAIAFGIILWLHTGNLATKFENLVLFLAYWVPPFIAVQIIDWVRARGRPNLRGILDLRALPSGWKAITAFVIGFGCSIPFMNNTIVVGPVAKAIDGGDLAYYVGFIATTLTYLILLRVRAGGTAPASQVAGVEPADVPAVASSTTP